MKRPVGLFALGLMAHGTFCASCQDGGGSTGREQAPSSPRRGPRSRSKHSSGSLKQKACNQCLPEAAQTLSLCTPSLKFLNLKSMAPMRPDCAPGSRRQPSPSLLGDASPKSWMHDSRLRSYIWWAEQEMTKKFEARGFSEPRGSHKCRQFLPPTEV